MRSLAVLAALLGKEVQQHAPALVGASVLLGIITLVTVTMGLEERWVTLLDAAQSVAWGAVPLLGLFVAERLVVVDHQAGTHEFLAALPIAPWQRATVRLGLGLAVVEGAAAAVLLGVAAVASRREGVPFGFLLGLWLRIGLYELAWFGLAFGIAHLGRFRWLVWWLLFVSMPLADAVSLDPPKEVYWLGLLAQGADQARLDVDWSALPQTIGWALAGIGLGFAVSGWRGGALLERVFRPATADQRARLIGIGMAAMLAAGAIGDLAPSRDPWETLPAVEARRATVRVAASPGSPLWETGQEAASALDALGEALGVDAWPPLVLLRNRTDPGELPVHPAPTTEVLPVSRVLLVDPARPRDDLVRRVVTEALLHRMSGLEDWDPDARWLLDGLAGFWLAHDRPGSQAAWAELAALGAGRAPAAVEDWYAVSGELGPDVAAAVARAGLVALEAEGGREAVLAAAQAVLAPRWRPSWPSGARLRLATRPGWVARRTGVARDAWLAAWEAELARAPAPVLPALPALSVEAGEGEAVVRWSGAPPPQTALEWLTLDPLATAPLPSDLPERRDVPPNTSELALPSDVRLRVAARWVREQPGLGWVTSPWTVQP